VARSFSGDKKHLQTVIKGAIGHQGTAVIDVISPCVTFNDHQGSTKSYLYVRDNRRELQTIDFVPFFEEIQIEDGHEPGTVKQVQLHDGSTVLLRKIEDEFDPTAKMNAVNRLDAAARAGEVLTGIFFIDTNKPDFLKVLHVSDQPLISMTQEQLRPPKSALDEVMNELM
jgi:2-oxoglutarate ferredoxin oxidoreductase subunit beta